MSLAQNIQSFQDEFIPTIPEKTLNQLMSELQVLIDTGIAEQAINQNDNFPGFVLPDSNNELRSFKDYLTSGPLVISFYRGAWCPYCNLHLSELRHAENQLKEMGFNVWFISIDKPELLLESLDTQFCDFSVVY